MRGFITLLLLLVACPGQGADPTDEPAIIDTDSDSDSDADTDSDTDSDTDTDTDTDTDSDIDTDTAPAPRFTDVSAAAGLNTAHWTLPKGFSARCAGSDDTALAAAVEDFDGDGDMDIFLGRFDEPGILWANRGDGTFEDVTEASGLRTTGRPGGAAWADFDGDGDLDLTLGYFDGGYLAIWRNEGGGRFVDGTDDAGLSMPSWATDRCALIWGVTYADYDRDGDLDLFVGSWNMDVDNEPVVPNRLYANRGDGTFEDVTRAVGLEVDYGVYTFAGGFADFDADGWPDLALPSDFGSNELWRHDTESGFEDISLSARITDVENAMGSVIADFDGDGDLDWFLTSILEPRDDFRWYWGYTGNRLYLNDGAAMFTDASEDLGVRDAQWAWGADAIDLENDGDLDLIVTNGRYAEETRAYLFEPFFDDPTRVFVRGEAGFVDRAADVGIAHTGQGRVVLPLDLEADGDRDVLLLGWAEEPVLYRNDTADAGHWLTVRIRREGMNRWGIGAEVRVRPRPGADPVLRLIDANPTYGGTAPIEAHFGLGQHEGPVWEVQVQLPEGEIVSLYDVATDQILVVSP